MESKDELQYFAAFAEFLEVFHCMAQFSHSVAVLELFLGAVVGHGTSLPGNQDLNRPDMGINIFVKVVEDTEQILNTAQIPDSTSMAEKTKFRPRSNARYY